LIPDTPTISLPHAAYIKQKEHLASSILNEHINTHASNSITTNDELNKIDGNKWVRMSKDISLDSKSMSTNMYSTLSDGSNNKWTKIANKINSLPSNTTKTTIKRIRSPNISNRWITQSEKIFKQKKNENI
jgi:hypothetical protein